MKTPVSLRVLGFISAVFGGVFALLGLLLWVGLIGGLVYIWMLAHRLPSAGIPPDIPPIVLLGCFLIVPSAVIFVAGINLLREKASAYRLALGAWALAAGCAIAAPLTFYALAHTVPAFAKDGWAGPSAPVAVTYLGYAAVAGLLLLLGRPRKRPEAGPDPGARA